MMTFTVGDRRVGDGEPTFVIAEAGSNHNGDIENAKALIDVAADAGADCVKFQTFRAEDLYVEESGQAAYLDNDQSIYEMIAEMEMPYEWIPELHDYARDAGLLFMSTPFDERSAEELRPYVPAFKVASYTMSHHPLLRRLADYDLPMLVSTGAHDESEVADTVDVLTECGATDFALLHCVASYPTPIEDGNVKVVETLRNRFDCLSGLSDHTLDPVTAPTAAVALGASVVEKHVTLDKSMEGPDHQFALEPDELDEMVTAIRETERVLGSPEIRVQAIEEELHDIARRAVQATEPIAPGETLTRNNVAILRPGNQRTGAAPDEFRSLLGRDVTERIEKGQGVNWRHVESDRE